MVIEKQNKNKNKQQQQKPSPLQNAESSKPRESTSRAAGAMWAFQETCFFLRSLHLPKQPRAERVIKWRQWWSTSAHKNTCSSASPLECPQQHRPCGKPERKTEASSRYQSLPVQQCATICFIYLSTDHVFALQRDASLTVYSLVKELLVLFSPLLCGVRKPLQLTETLKHIVID